MCEECKLEPNGKGRFAMSDGECQEDSYECMAYQEGSECEKKTDYFRDYFYGIILAFM